MKNKNTGYTLIETLVVVGIIGLVSALLLPKFVENTNKIANGKKLGRCVQLVQNNTTNLMQEVQKKSENGDAVLNLTSLQFKDLFTKFPDGIKDIDFLASEGNLFKYASSFLNVEPNNLYVIGDIKNYYGSSFNNMNATLFGDTTAYSFKKNNAVIVVQNFPDNVGDAQDSQVLTRVYIDINGQDGPNRMGRDIFMFGLANNGHLIPAGSEAYNNNIYGDEVSLYSTNCTNTNVVDGLSCAAKVMADKWEIKY